MLDGFSSNTPFGFELLSEAVASVVGVTRGSSTADPVLEGRVDARVAALSGLPAGPELAAALGQLDVAKLSDWELVEVLRARYRQASHDRG